MGPGIWRKISLVADKSVTQQAQSIREYLGITVQLQCTWRDDDNALKNWRSAVEKAGIFVFKSAFKQKEISGFCLIDTNLPVIYLNNSTTKTRQIFSLLHEMAHLLMSINGLSKIDKQYIDFLPQAEQKIERFCNAIAAEVLIPSHDFVDQTAAFPTDIEKAPEEYIADLSNRYGVSREAVLRRLLDSGRVSRNFYERKAREWTAQMKKITGGSWYLNQGAYLSDYFAREVVARHFRHQISMEEASDLLGIKPKNYSGLEERILSGAGA
jgi:Zn-dependent peptidase ImmA (M78 family)